MDVGMRAEAGRIALDDPLAQRVDRGRDLDRVAGPGQRLQRVVQGFEHPQIGGGAGVAGIGREVEQHQADLALRARHAAQIDQLGDAGGQRIGPLADARLHVVRDCCAAGLPAERPPKTIEPGGAVELRQRHHHGGLDRQQAAIEVFPLVERLELDRGARAR